MAHHPSNQTFLGHSPYAMPVVGISIAASLGIWFYWAGLIAPPELPEDYFSSYAHMHGLTLLMTLVPAYSAACAILSYRRSMQLAQQVNPQLSVQVRRTPWPLLVTAGFCGLLYAVVFNIRDPMVTFTNATRYHLALTGGQILIWVFVFVLLAWRIRISHLFNRQGQMVDIDIFEMSHLRPFAQIGLTDVLLIAGGMVLSTVQSLDANFRLVNYLYSVPILLPAMIFLALYPMWSIHQRILFIKQDQLRQLNQQILQAPKDLAVEHVNALEVLLQRRERLQALPTWPADLSIVQRFLFYLIIPPLAWLGAAVVEMMVDRAVS